MASPIDPTIEPSKEAYNHGMALDTENKRVQCCYCGKIVPGFNRLQQHLGGIRGNITECPDVPVEVKDFFRNRLMSVKVGHLVKEIGELDNPNPPLKRICTPNAKVNGVKSPRSVSSQNGNIIAGTGSSLSKPTCYYKRRLTSQNGNCDKDGVDSDSAMVKRSICRFFLENGIDFGAISSVSFNSMMNNFFKGDEIKRCIPTVPELRGWMFDDELHEIEKYVNNVRLSWAQTGCSVLLDGWTGHLGNSLINVIVDCPEGPIYLRSADVSPSTTGDNDNALQVLLEEVLEEVGIQNVVQIVAHTTSERLEEISKQLIEKHRSLFWTVSATHCMSLILDKIAMIDSIKLTLVKAKTITKFIYSRVEVLKLLKKYISSPDLVIPSKIKSAASFLTLENILDEKSNLKLMFSSSDWLSSSWSSSVEGELVANLISDSSFWGGVNLAVKSSIPLVKAISLLSGDEKTNMGFIYETMDQVKETICEEFGSKESQYTAIWNIIDEIWNTILHSPLHAAGYFLNPRLHYTEDFFSDTEVAGGLLITIVRMAADQCTQDLITRQLDVYGGCKGDFKIGTDNNSQKSLSPVKWWSRFGDHCPELQKLAVRVLSQTCNGAEVYGLRRHIAEKLLSSKKNTTEYKQLHKQAYLRYNLKLKQSKMGAKFDIISYEVDPSEDWIVDESYREVGSSRGVPSKVEPKCEV
ncbi:hypothetical protein SOVF_028040 [Spinacia oleracea]|uniref:DUF659 domain-containing protein n=1 Tax=Spinacia oleracea TaxID=3562 RepID=A0A9R0I2L6_SPIOL|nr:uncharacterized protein LOC110781758 [Spinacia oleracea]KNA23081.1 hypothetical protein SOVF_028040 [Spinacia oleracea]